MWGLGLSLGFRQVGYSECRGMKAQWWQQVLAFEWLQSFGFRECDVALQSKVILCIPGLLQESVLMDAGKGGQTLNPEH